MSRFAALILILIIILTSCVTVKMQRTVAVDYYNLGNEYLDLKKYSESIKAYEKSLSYDNKNGKTILNLIIAYQKQNIFKEAEKLIIKEYNNKFGTVSKQQLLMLLGNNYFYQQNYKLSEKTFHLFTETYPDNERGYFNLALTYLKLADEEKAIEYFLISYKKKSDFVPAIYNIASYYYSINDFKQSLYFYKKLSSLNDSKNDPDVYYKLGLIEFENEEYELARDRVAQAVLKDKTNPEYYIALARIYAKGYKNKKKTLENIKNALENGYTDFKKLSSLSEFEVLTDYQEYKDLIDSYKKKK